MRDRNSIVEGQIKIFVLFCVRINLQNKFWLEVIIMNKKLVEIKDKYFIKLLLLGIANLSMLMTISNANTTCIFLTHQEKMPEKAKKLRKF